jgi:hypothetical protein
MADTMRVRIARAIAEANMEDFEDAPNLHLAMADAALAAMREPTEAMVEAARDPAITCNRFSSVRWDWTRMIEAARNEQPDEEADVERSS